MIKEVEEGMEGGNEDDWTFDLKDRKVDEKDLKRCVKNTNGGNITVTNTGKLNISSVIKTKQGDVNINSKDGISFSGTISTNNGDVKVENTDTDGIILATASMINANGKIDIDNKGTEGIISSSIITNIGNDTITINNTSEKVEKYRFLCKHIITNNTYGGI